MQKKLRISKDAMIIGAVLLLAAAAFIVHALTKPAPLYAVIYVGNEVYAKLPADEYGSTTIDQGDGRLNIVTINETGVYMEYSTCKNQICTHHAPIDPERAEELLLSNWIVCLPNGVSVSLEDGE